MRIATIAADANSKVNEMQKSIVAGRLSVYDASRARYWYPLAGTAPAMSVVNIQPVDMLMAAATVAISGTMKNQRNWGTGCPSKPVRRMRSPRRGRRRRPAPPNAWLSGDG